MQQMYVVRLKAKRSFNFEFRMFNFKFIYCYKSISGDNRNTVQLKVVLFQIQNRNS